MKLRNILILLLIGCFSFHARDLYGEEKSGEVKRISCKADPKQSYEVYLPQTYSPQKKWPVIFCFNYSGKGSKPVNLLKRAAEKYGYIAVGSNNAKNGPHASIMRAQEAMWKDVNARFSIDPKRSYSMGFSGGARMSIRMARRHMENFSGVIFCGAAFQGVGYFRHKTHLAYFGICGGSDKNYREFMQGEAMLSARHIPHWVEVFRGGHGWPPEQLIFEGVEFFQVMAMRRGLIPKDAAFIEKLIEDRLRSAETMMKTGKAGKTLRMALRKYRNTASFFEGEAGFEKVEKAVAKLIDNRLESARKMVEKRPLKALNEYRITALYFKGITGVEKAEKELAALEKDLKDVLDAFGGVRDPRDQEKFTHSLQALIGIAKGKGKYKADAQSVLGRLLQDLKHYGFEALQLKGRKAWSQAAFFFESAMKIEPEDNDTAYNAACANSLLDSREKAVEMLGAAVKAGFSDLDRIENEIALANIREEAGFKTIVESLKKR